ncbi:MAG: PAS domain S-box protein [Methanobacteriota archaeon]
MAVTVVSKDITKRNKAESLERVALEYAENIVATVREPLLVLDGEMRVVSANRSFYQTFQVTAEETEKRLLYEVGNHQWDIPALRKLLEEIIPKVTHVDNFEITHDFPNIGRKVMLLNARRMRQLVKNTPLILLAIEDITERKRTEEDTVRESEEKYRSLVESTGDSIYMLDKDLGYLSANKQMLSNLGLSRDEVIGKSYGDFYSPKETNEISGAVNEVIKTGKDVQHEYTDKKRGRVFLRTLSPVKDPKTGEVKAITVVSKDITELRTAGEILLQSEEKLKRILDFSPDIIVIFDLNGNVIDCNRVTLNTFKFSSKAELIGRKISDLIIPEDRQKIIEDLAEAVRLGSMHEREYRLKNGREIPAEISVSAIPDASGKPASLVAVMRDISERKRAEEKMREFIYKANDISRGECYLLKSRDMAYRTFANLVLHDVPGLCISREKPDKMMEYGVPKGKIVVMSPTPMKDFETIEGLQQVSMTISSFLKENDKSVLLLDGLGYLISRNDFNSVYKLLQEKRFNFAEANATLLLPVDLAIFDEREKALLASEMKVLG